MKKLWIIAGSALVMSACSDNDAEMRPTPAGNNDLVTLTEISASLPATRAYLEDVEFGAGKEVKTLWSSGDYITVWSEQEPDRLLLYRLKSGADTPNAVFEVVGSEEGVHGTQFYALYNGSSSASKQITLSSVQNNNINRPSNNIAEGAAPMAAYAAVEDGHLSNVKFAFKNLCGIMAVTVTTDIDATLSSISLTSTTNLAGSGEVRFIDGVPSFRVTANASRMISRELGNQEVKGGAPATFYFVVPAASYGTLKMDVMSSTSLDPVWSRTRTITGNGLSIGAGSITRIANVTVKTAAPHVYVEGDLYPNGATGDAVKGIVYEVAEDGLSGKMIYPRVLGTAKWTTLGADGDIPLSENGELNMEKAKKNIDAFPAFKLCADLPAVDNQSWYMPSRSELEALIPSINVINSSYKTLKGDDAGSLIPLNTETSVRNWSSTGYVAPNNAVRAYTARYSYTIDEETDEDISEWKISGSSVSSAYNVLAITKFKSK